MWVTNDLLILDVEMLKGSWFGLGYGPTMTNTDMVAFEVSTEGQVEVSDWFSRGQTYPERDEH